MSTRCQVQVISASDPGEQVTLYHHWDGYPSNMVPIIAKAYRKVMRPVVRKYDDGTTDSYDQSYKARGVGYAAGFLCWADAGGFEPEPGQELHSDIEYLYRVYLCGSRSVNGSVRPTWEVEVLATARGFWDHPSVENMEVYIPRTPLETLAKEVAKENRTERRKRAKRAKQTA